MTLQGWLSIIAIILAPIIAVRIETCLALKREKRERRLKIFRNLMATRAVPLSRLHVDNLNLIDIEFSGKDKKEKTVIQDWKIYLDHLCQNTGNPGWQEKREELLTNLLYSMAISLGYSFDKVQIKRAAYYPKGFGEQDFELQLIRKYLLDVLGGDKSLPVQIKIDEEASRTQDTNCEEPKKSTKEEIK